jgi:methylase of polypeptide subunit release factors
MEAIHRLVPQALAALRPGGWLVLEISGTIAGPVQQALAAWDEVRMIPDLQSIPRVAQARKPRS